MASHARRGAPLTREEILTTALRLIDAGGVEALTMRRLAAELSVNPMSLYHHVENKTALLEGVCSLVVARLEPPPDDGSAWQDRLRALAHTYRSLARLHPALWSYVQVHPEMIGREDGMWGALCRTLLAAGVPKEDLAATGEALYSFVSGFVTAESRDELGRQRGAEDVDRTFELAVDIIVAGLRRTTG
ncbi:TetR/AcrR family transcriptional regulator [Marinactinospora thermotolerans]|uniref:Transcriptional regulator, TetR family n=1 Tax=Marinactinospora thermotolerans DSM 45154 TaxID=1122192 RepID=A0A1T4NKN2_9ACTN|nr:TetR/AcrR family transcriptional regulator [Marinactinospora thermotolerans]SJZ79830.1 transcriptional regulator, TetR family [Marinactinospora thermotolerans DSM 45154]